MRALPLLALLLSGCSNLSGMQRVEVPVTVVKPCLVASEIPTEPASRMVAGVNVERLAAAAALDVIALRGYAQSLRAMLLVCAEDTK